MNELFDLTGQVGLVTGAGAGLGVTFATALAEAGAAVVCADINGEHANRTADALTDRGFKAIAATVDVTDVDAVQDVVAKAIETFGRLDVVVANAGIATVGPAEETAIDDWKRVIDVNLTGVFLTDQAAANAMIAAGTGGSIINIASILGAVASEPVAAAPYAASKGGVVNLTRDLAVHWADKGIRVNALGPAYFPSDMTSGIFADPGLHGQIEKLTPLGRTGNPDELKGPLLLLASRASSYMTGQTIYVDGGWTAW
jgi:NAD(P)-dependent dehydrogenase (short-subunit alcohol dehydrogenase family)